MAEAEEARELEVQLARQEHESMMHEEELYALARWESVQEAEIAEAERQWEERAKQGVEDNDNLHQSTGASSSNASTVPVTVSAVRAWDDWALASELGEGAGPRAKRRLVTKLRVDRGFPAEASGPGMLAVANLTLGVPVHLSLAVLLHDDDGPSYPFCTEPVVPPPVSVEQFLQSEEGRRVYRWWSEGLLTSLVVNRDLGAGVLEAFRAQKAFLEARAG